MNHDENLVFEYLKKTYGDEVTHEPDGNKPPDFCVNFVCAVEARRLNQQDSTSLIPEGLENLSFDLNKVVNNVLKSFETQYIGKTYGVMINFKRPLNPDFQVIKKEMKDALQKFLDSGLSNSHNNLPINSEIDFDIYLYQPVDRRVFIYTGMFDSDFGGGTIKIYIENIRYCIMEKSLKIEHYLSRYKEWWLVLVDYLGEGLNENEKEEVCARINNLGNFDKVIVISSDGKRQLLTTVAKH